MRLPHWHVRLSINESGLISELHKTIIKDKVKFKEISKPKLFISLIFKICLDILNKNNCPFFPQVHVGGVLARLIDSPYTKRATFQSPFPRRSSLLPSRCNETSNFDDSALHLLSPVPHTSTARHEQKESLG